MTGTVRRHQIRSIGVNVEKLMKPIFGARGFGAAAIVTEWEKIVGPVLARSTMPERIAYAQGERSEGTLHLRVGNASLALELQHLEPQMIERINGHFGYRAVAKVRLIQGPVKRIEAPKPKPRPALPAEKRQALDRRLGAIDDPDLKAALRGLGEAIGRGRS
jgi:hypothetical protein